MAETNRLRPIERRVRRLVHEGMSEAEIARRFRRSPEHVARVIELSDLPDRTLRAPTAALRPVERRILRWRDAGVRAAQIAPRFRRSPEFVTRVEDLARYKLSR